MDAGSAPPALAAARERKASSRGLYLNLWAFSEALFGGREGPPPPERIRWLCDDTLDFLRNVGGRSRNLIRVCLWALSWVSPILIFRLPPLRRLPIATRVRALERAERSLLSLPLLAVKAAVCISYYEHPDVRAEYDLDDDCMVGSGP